MYEWKKRKERRGEQEMKKKLERQNEMTHINNSNNSNRQNGVYTCIERRIGLQTR